MFIFCVSSPDYNASDYSQYEPAPEPSLFYFVNGKWTRDIEPEEDPGYTEEDFDRIVEQDENGADDTTYFLVTKLVTKLGTTSKNRIAQEEALIRYMEEEVYLKRIQSRHTVEVLGPEGYELHTVFPNIKYWAGEENGFSLKHDAVKLPRWKAEGLIYDELDEGREQHFRYEMCSEALLPTNEELEALYVGT